MKIKSDKEGKAPIGFESMPDGKHIVTPESLEMSENKITKEGKPLQYNTVFRDPINPDAPNNSILLSTNFGHIKGIVNFLTYLDKSGIAKKLSEQYPSKFPYDPKGDHLEWDDDNFLDKKDGKPVSVKQGFITAVRLAMKGAMVEINVKMNEVTKFPEITDWYSPNSLSTVTKTDAPDSGWL